VEVAERGHPEDVRARAVAVLEAVTE